MSKQRIEPRFDDGAGKLLLGLRKEEVDLREQAISYNGKRFAPKDEVHITIIGSALGEDLLNALDTDESMEELRALIDETDWRYTLLNRWHHVVREGDEPAESIIRMVDVRALPQFYARLEALAGLSIPPRPAHITLYTWGDPGGIGIATWNEFDELVAGTVDPAVVAGNEK